MDAVCEDLRFAPNIFHMFHLHIYVKVSAVGFFGAPEEPCGDHIFFLKHKMYIL